MMSPSNNMVMSGSGANKFAGTKGGQYASNNGAIVS